MRDQMVSRRELLKRLGLTGVGILTLPQLSQVLAFQQQARQQTPAPQGALTAVEAATLAAMCARIIPSDEAGPGAAEARASVYIDRSLAGWLAGSRQVYAEGLAQVEAAARAKHNRSFVDTTAAEQDAVLAGIEQTPFFALVRTHTIQGTFCDPAYGGNANFVGWDLLGYPGIRLNVTAADQGMSQYPQAIRRSAYDYAMFAAAH
jgi:gluconate 2-dehydrogenase gamma chain